MPNYYNHADYVSEKKMRAEGYTKTEMAEQRETNWWIRLEWYATHPDAVAMYLNKFIAMVEKWDDDCETHYSIREVDRIAELAIGMGNRGGWGDQSCIPYLIQTHKRMEQKRQSYFNELAEKMMAKEITADQAIAVYDAKYPQTPRQQQ